MQTKKYKYDSLIAWSGGVESTALVVWALNEGYTPLCYHVRSVWDERTEREQIAIQTMKQLLNVDCLDVENIAYGPTTHNSPDEATHTFDFDFWMYWGLKLFTVNEGFTELWYGNNSGRDVSGDGKGDKTSDCFLKCKEGITLMANGLRPDHPFDIVAPFEQPKMTQWDMIPDNIKPHVISSDRIVDMSTKIMYNDATDNRGTT
tara:strand:- start:141 stop:752 length:612 start_codon:yes stop_codon:yes gene_type:complete